MSNNMFGNKLPPIYLITDDEIRYFEQKLARAIENNVSEEGLALYKKQLDLLKDAAIIYHEQRTPIKLDKNTIVEFNNSIQEK